MTDLVKMFKWFVYVYLPESNGGWRGGVFDSEVEDYTSIEWFVKKSVSENKRKKIVKKGVDEGWQKKVYKTKCVHLWDMSQCFALVICILKSPKSSR